MPEFVIIIGYMAFYSIMKMSKYKYSKKKQLIHSNSQ